MYRLVNCNILLKLTIFIEFGQIIAVEEFKLHILRLFFAIDILKLLCEFILESEMGHMGNALG